MLYGALFELKNHAFGDTKWTINHLFVLQLQFTSMSKISKSSMGITDNLIKPWFLWDIIPLVKSWGVGTHPCFDTSVRVAPRIRTPSHCSLPTSISKLFSNIVCLQIGNVICVSWYYYLTLIYAKWFNMFGSSALDHGTRCWNCGQLHPVIVCWCWWW